MYIFPYICMIYDHSDLRRSNHLLNAGSALGSDTVSWAVSSRAFKTSEDGAYATPFGSLLRCMPALMEGENVFFICNLNFLCFNLCLLSLIFPLRTTVRPWLHPLSNPLTVGYREDALLHPPQSHFFSRLNKSQSLSLSSQDNCSSNLFEGPPLSSFQMVDIFPVLEGPKTGSNVWRLSHRY